MKIQEAMFWGGFVGRKYSQCINYNLKKWSCQQGYLILIEKKGEKSYWFVQFLGVFLSH